MDNIAAEAFIQFVAKTLQFFVLKTTNLIHMLKTAYFRNDPKYSNSICKQNLNYILTNECLQIIPYEFSGNVKYRFKFLVHGRIDSP